MFQAAQLRLDANRQVKAKGAKHKYLLRGRVVCTKCRNNYRCRTPYGKYSYYLHNGPKHRGGVTNFRVDALDEAAKSFMLSVLQNPDVIIDQLSAEEDGIGAEFILQQIAHTKKQRGKTKVGLRRAREAYTDGTFTKVEYLDVKDRLEKRDDALKRSVARLEMELEPDPYELEGLEAFVREHIEQFAGDEEGTKEFYKWEDRIYFVNLLDIIIDVTGDRIRITAAGPKGPNPKKKVLDSDQVVVIRRRGLKYSALTQTE